MSIYMYMYSHVQCTCVCMQCTCTCTCHNVYTMYNRSSFCAQVLCRVIYKVYYIDSMVEQFTVRFNTYYTAAVATDFTSLSLPAQVDYVKYLFKVRASYNVHIHVVLCHRWDLILLVCSVLTHLLRHSYTHYPH